MKDNKNLLTLKSDAPLSIRFHKNWFSRLLDVTSKILVPLILGFLLYSQHETSKAVEVERLASEKRNKQYLVQNEENA